MRTVRISKIWSMSIILTSITLVFFVLVFNPTFETNDDAAMATILYGIRGDYNSHLVFINILIGKILSTLMRLAPTVKWYVVFQYSVIYISFIVIFYSIMKLFEDKNKKNIKYIIIGIIISVWGYECFVKLQFTKTAGCCAVAGGLLIFTSMKLKKNKLHLLLGGSLLCLSSMIRFNAFELVILIIFSIGIYILKGKYLENHSLKPIASYIIIFCTIISVSFALQFLDSAIYNSNDEWKEYKEFNHLRAELLDRGFPDYNENIEQYKELGISEIDLLNWNSWNFSDKEAFTIETMKSIIELKEDKIIDVKFFVEYVSTFLKGFISERVFIGFVLVFGLWLFFSRNGILGIVSLFIILIFTNMYFFWNNRYLQYRVDTVMWLVASIVIIYMMSEGEMESFSLKITGYILTIFLLLNINVFATNIADKGEYQNKINVKEYLGLINEDSENVYFVTIGSSPENLAFGLFDLPEVGLLNNYYSLGGWQTNSPITNDVLNKYSIKNPYRDMIDNEHAYVIDNVDIALRVKYINGRYSQDAFAVLVKQAMGNMIYKIVTKLPDISREDIIFESSDINSDMSMNQDATSIILNGFAYKYNSNSFKQKAYTMVYCNDTGTYRVYYSILKEMENNNDVYNGKYSGFQTVIDKSTLEFGSYTIFQVIDVGGELYCTGQVEYNKGE